METATKQNDWATRWRIAMASTIWSFCLAFALLISALVHESAEWRVFSILALLTLDCWMIVRLLNPPPLKEAGFIKDD